MQPRHRPALALALLLSVVACDDDTGDPEVIFTPRADASPGDQGVEVADLGDATLLDASAPVDMRPVDQSVDAGVDAGGLLDDGLLDRGVADAAADLSPPIDAAPDAMPDAGPTCGDGIVEGDEACDDGNTLPGDYCGPDCRAVTGRCGDGVLQNIEFCDDGAIMAGCDATHDGGDGTCVPPGACVDGYVLEGDACAPIDLEAEIEIFVANDCSMQVRPPSFDVPRGRTVSFTYLNRSRDYPVDVWLSYGGGFLDLPVGQSWDDRFIHCTGPRRPRQAAADISTACSMHRFVINCL